MDSPLGFDLANIFMAYFERIIFNDNIIPDLYYAGNVFLLRLKVDLI